jgi:hypothetical protein
LAHRLLDPQSVPDAQQPRRRDVGIDPEEAVGFVTGSAADPM